MVAQVKPLKSEGTELAALEARSREIAAERRELRRRMEALDAEWKAMQPRYEELLRRRLVG